MTSLIVTHSECIFSYAPEICCGSDSTSISSAMLPRYAAAWNSAQVEDVRLYEMPQHHKRHRLSYKTSNLAMAQWFCLSMSTICLPGLSFPFLIERISLHHYLLLPQSDLHFSVRHCYHPPEDYRSPPPPDHKPAHSPVRNRAKFCFCGQAPAYLHYARNSESIAASRSRRAQLTTARLAIQVLSTNSMTSNVTTSVKKALIEMDGEPTG